MKKRCKVLLSMGAVFGGIALYNHCIFRRVNKKLENPQVERIYPWRFGEIRYIKKGKGQPLLLLHGIGIGGGLEEFEKNIDLLSKHYKVYALDFLGFGRSEKPNITYNAYLYTTLINHFVEDVINQKVFAVGSGSSADFLTMAYQLRPDLYKKLILVSPTGLTIDEEGLSCRERFMKNFIQIPVLGTFFYNCMASRQSCKSFLKRFGFYDKSLVTDGVVEMFYDNAHFGGSDAKVPIGFLFGKYFDIQIKKHLIDVDIPVTILWGEENDLYGVEELEDLLDNDHIQTALFRKTKLFPHMENPTAFYRLCKKFFNE